MINLYQDQSFNRGHRGYENEVIGEYIALFYQNSDGDGLNNVHLSSSYNVTKDKSKLSNYFAATDQLLKALVTNSQDEESIKVAKKIINKAAEANDYINEMKNKLMVLIQNSTKINPRIKELWAASEPQPSMTRRL